MAPSHTRGPSSGWWWADAAFAVADADAPSADDDDDAEGPFAALSAAEAGRYVDDDGDDGDDDDARNAATNASSCSSSSSPSSARSSAASCDGRAVVIPAHFDAAFGSYPNLLNVTDDDRKGFHPVVIYPAGLSSSPFVEYEKYYFDGTTVPSSSVDDESEQDGDDGACDGVLRRPSIVVDAASSSVISAIPVADNRHRQGMASEEYIAERRRRQEGDDNGHRSWQRLVVRFRRWGGRVLCRTVLSTLLLGGQECFRLRAQWNVGKYDENRVEMYQSALFVDTANTIDGFGGRRTVHLGVDLGAPVGTPVYAFADGVVHSVGYNAPLGDYGYVIVVEHYWGAAHATTTGTGTGTGAETTTNNRVWALYGHLDQSVLRARGRLKEGASIRRGQLLGRVGDAHENGGWKDPHVHFQLSLRPPDRPHDMPGASSVEDRVTALLQYPDPRYVLGHIY